MIKLEKSLSVVPPWHVQWSFQSHNLESHRLCSLRAGSKWIRSIGYTGPAIRTAYPVLIPVRFLNLKKACSVWHHCDPTLNWPLWPIRFGVSCATVGFVHTGLVPNGSGPRPLHVFCAWLQVKTIDLLTVHPVTNRYQNGQTGQTCPV